MTDALDLDGFRRLAETYGADLSRWPLETRQAAAIFAAKAEGTAILEEAERLDAALNVWRTPHIPAGLIERTIQSGSTLATRTTRRLKIWWTGIGLAAALSGAIAGSLGAATLSPYDAPTHSSTLFGDVPEQED